VTDEDTYVIALVRERRETAPPNWQDVVRATPGVTVVGDASPLRMQVRASSEAIAAIRDRLGDDVHVEKVVLHYPS
jgi:hypothetical protein